MTLPLMWTLVCSAPLRESSRRCSVAGSLHHWAMEPISNEIFLDRPRTKYDFSSWRVLKTACLMLNVASLAALEVYGRHVEKLVTQWPSAWGLIYQAEDAARAERMAKLRRQFTVESGLGRQVPRDWNPKEPWSCIFVQLTKDDSYWSEKVHIPAAAWVAAGARGQPVVASEAAVKAHVPGLQDSVRDTTPPGQDNMDPRRKQANRDKRAARKRKFQADMDELRNLRQGHGGHKQQHAGGGKDSGGKGKGKSKDQSGTPICFSWASGTGVCGKLPAGAECASPVKRAHKCRKCLSPSHQDSACTR